VRFNTVTSCRDSFYFLCLSFYIMLRRIPYITTLGEHVPVMVFRQCEKCQARPPHPASSRRQKRRISRFPAIGDTSCGFYLDHQRMKTSLLHSYFLSFTAQLLYTV
jgi:hypothetical protein